MSVFYHLSFLHLQLPPVRFLEWARVGHDANRTKVAGLFALKQGGYPWLSREAQCNPGVLRGGKDGEERVPEVMYLWKRDTERSNSWSWWWREEAMSQGVWVTFRRQTGQGNRSIPHPQKGT
jgi:hypothetical protein